METQFLDQSSGGPRLLEDLTSILLHRDNKEALHFLQNYQPVKDGVTSLRVLLYGPVGSGKSSFINSIVTVMRGQISNLVLASSIEGSTSFTKRVREQQAGVSLASG